MAERSPQPPSQASSQGHDPETRWLSVACALGALLVLFLHAGLGPRYQTEDPAGELFSNQISFLAGITVASFLTTAPERRRWVYLTAFPATACGVVFPWLHALYPINSVGYRLLNALSPVGMAMVAFTVTWALRVTAADNALLNARR